jgi:hypothetical protein
MPQILSDAIAMGPTRSLGQKKGSTPTQGSNAARQSLWCAWTGAAGMIANLFETGCSGGMVVDAYDGRGATLREFRNYMARHLGVSIPSAVGGGSGSNGGSGGATAPVTVTFFDQGPKEGVSEGTKPSRELESVSFQESYNQVRSVLSEQKISVEWVHSSTRDFAYQASKAAAIL